MIRQRGFSMQSTQITLVLAEDHKDVRIELQQLLKNDFLVMDSVNGGKELVTATCNLKPQVVVSDIRMRDLDGIEAARQILELGCCEAIVMLTMCNEMEMVSKAFEAGARGYVLKVDASEELIPAIHAALDGKKYISASVTALR